MQIVIRHVFYEATGYGNSARQIALAMDQAGADIKLESVGRRDEFLDPSMESLLQQMENKPYQEDRILLKVGTDLTEEDRRFYRKVVNCSMWETNKAPAPMANECHKFDAIILPNSFNRQAFWDAGVRIPLYIAPYGVDSNLYTSEGVKERFGEGDNTFLFLSVFGWSYRKGPDVLIKAFLEEFEADEPVALVVKTHGLDIQQKPDRDSYDSIVQSVSKSRLPKFNIVTRVMTPDETAAMYRGADCFVLSTRGEGVGLPVLESMSCGVPVIATGWSGLVDFLGPDSGYLLPYKLVPAGNVHYTNLYGEDQFWAEPDQGSLQNLMRRVYVRREEAKNKGRKAREMANHWNWNRTAHAFIDALEQVAGKPIARK
ncbi:glycosyltransferase [Paenibacillus sp. LMG 31456]|uniref:Glycosyltransferase n=1 Tax=Paenibacillus foliorum TaxID=2654974 RepID=A0A972K403_9BACL|nr:glycosyltransferase family 4 protein [Paenibacillus foliorum]NOU98346.1 glycosyltransferase [Paenibacillus foliorum]